MGGTSLASPLIAAVYARLGTEPVQLMAIIHTPTRHIYATLGGSLTKQTGSIPDTVQGSQHWGYP